MGMLAACFLRRVVGEGRDGVDWAAADRQAGGRKRKKVGERGKEERGGGGKGGGGGEMM